MITGIKWGRIEKVLSGDTTYYYKHKDVNALDSAEDWFAIRKIVSGSNSSFKFRMGCFANYATEW
jgi:hypothetical protein